MKKAMLSLAIGAALLAPLSVRGEVTADTPGKGAPGPHAGFQASREATGTVIETMDSGGYTYVQVDTGAQSIWAAAPRFEVSVGDRVTVPPGAPMANFYSKTLDRSFEMIYFVGGVVLEDTAGAAPQPAHPEIAAPGAAIEMGEIARADGGVTIAEIFDGGTELAGQEIIVRGKVVKFTPRIMGTNFLHLVDGTTSKDGRSDLTATTQTEVSVGAIVTVRGTLGTDKDFGFNYQYDVIVEDASVTED
jgi:hypothetical protein